MSNLLVTSNITLNLQRPNSNVVVYAKQYDMISRVVNASLVSGAEVWDPPAGCEIVVMYTKPDGKMGIYDVADGYPEYSDQKTYEIGDRVIHNGYIYSCQVAILVPEAWTAGHWNFISTATPAVAKTGTGKIRITLAEQALNVEGNVHVEISFYQSSTRLTTLSFTISVEKGVPNDDALKSDNYFNILSGMIQNLLGASSYPPQIDPTTRNWIIWNADKMPPGPEVTDYSSVGPQGIKGDKGDQGWSIVSVTKTGGTGAEGTIDTYTMRNNNPSTSQQVVGTFNVYNGRDGRGAKGSRVPLADGGTGSAGELETYSSEDHQHPLNVSDDTPQGITSMASAGEATTYARSDHSHPFGDIIDYIYPVGSIYLSLNEEFNPNVAYGGEWELISNRFLVGAGDLYDLEDTGGEAEHTLTSAESGQKAVSIASSGGHSHTITTKYQKVFAAGTNKDGYWGNGTGSNTTMASIASGTGTHTHSIAGSNAAQPHNNMPPYLAVYMWKRTA